MSLLTKALPDHVDCEALQLDAGTEIFWCKKMPFCRVFSLFLGLPLQWSIEGTCAKTVRKHIQIAAERGLKFWNHFLNTVQFLESAEDHHPL